MDGARIAPHESRARDTDGGRRPDRGLEPRDLFADVRNHARGRVVVCRRARASDDLAGQGHRHELRERAADVDADGVRPLRRLRPVRRGHSRGSAGAGGADEGEASLTLQPPSTAST